MDKLTEFFLRYSYKKISFSETSVLENQKKFYLSEVFYSVKFSTQYEIQIYNLEIEQSSIRSQ